MIDYKQISHQDGEILVKTARKVVEEYLISKNKMKLDEKFENCFSFNSGVFVTLNDQSGLRGCIGFPLPDKKLYIALKDAAIAAATEDPRFPKVEPEELDKITFEVTVLTPPEEIKVEDPLNYPSNIQVGTDGLIVKFGYSSGLLLPQVPIEYSWNAEEFLGHTCEKAGLQNDIWKNSQIKVLKFQGVIFKEESSNGKVVPVKL